MARGRENLGHGSHFGMPRYDSDLRDMKRASLGRTECEERLNRWIRNYTGNGPWPREPGTWIPFWDAKIRFRSEGHEARILGKDRMRGASQSLDPKLYGKWPVAARTWDMDPILGCQDTIPI